MNAKLLAAMILGLVFQLSGILPAAVLAAPCRAVSESCACCECGASCACAENSDSQQKPAPAAPETGSVLKVPAAKPDGTRVSVERALPPRTAAATAAFPHVNTPAGYAGTRFSVAFCTFVI